MALGSDDQRRRGGASRIPPHNLQAEESLLGALLLSRDTIMTVAELGITPTDFYKPAHQHIFEAVRVLAFAGDPVDPVTVANELRRASLLEEIGGAAALVELQAATPAISNAARYARIVQDTALLRRLIGVAGEIAELGYDEPDDVAKAIDMAETKVFEIAERHVTDSTKAIGDLLHLAINDLEQAYERGTTVSGTPTGYVDLDELLSGLQPSTLNVVGARPSMGKCVAWDTEILDPATGELVTASELHRRGSEGAWVQVVALDDVDRTRVASPSAFVDDGMKPVFKVTTASGRTVRITAAHPFLTESGWRPLAELRPGTRVAVPTRLPWFGTDRVPGCELVLLAYLLGEGGLRYRGERRQDEAVTKSRALGVDALEVLHRHGLWHVDDEAFAMPPALFRLPRDQLLLFLGRLVAMNGAIRVSRDERVAFAARSRRLVAQLQHLLLRFGVVTSQRVTAGRAGSSVHVLRVDPVSALTADHDAMAQLGLDTLALVGAAGAGRRLHPTSPLAAEDVGRVRGDVLWDELVAIEVDGFEQVYDLTVPHWHNFVAADVYVHNTAFALGMATHIAVESQLPVLFFSLEMGHRELTQRILSAEAKVDSTKMRTGRLTEQDWSKIGKAIGRLEAPLYLDDNPNLTVMEIRAKSRRLAARHGKLGLVVVDYLQLMSGRYGAENRQVEVSEISRGLKILARELEVPILALSQLSRNLESRSDKRPMLADLRESGSIEQDADVVMFIYRDEVYNAESPDRGAAEIIVSKHRSGPIGTKRLAYLGPYTRFENATSRVL